MSALAEMPLKVSPNSLPAFFQADGRDVQRARDIWIEMLQTQDPSLLIFLNNPLRGELFFKLLIWFSMEGRDTVIEPFWASKMWEHRPEYVQAVMRDLALDDWVVINKQFGQVSSYGLSQKLQSFFSDPMDMLDDTDHHKLAGDIRELEEENRKAKRDAENASIVEDLARITLLRGHLPRTNGKGRWDEVTENVARSMGITLVHYSTCVKRFESLTRIHEQIHAWINDNQ